MILRKGKSKAILEASLDAALLAVEVYNKPRTTFRSQAYITLMIMAWTRLLHAYFNNSIGDKYYYKDKDKPNRYAVIDGDKKAWELTECIKQYKKLSEPVKKNLEFFIKIRNKIEHRHIDPKEVDVSIFGECQSMLFNYENTLIQLFGSTYSINESLVYSLQFSQLRTTGQQKSGKSVLSKDTSEILSYIQKFKATLGDEVYASQEFSIKLLQIPKVSNNDRDTPAMEFVRWDTLNDADKKDAYEKITTIIKDKKIITEAANVKRLKPGQVVTKVNELVPATKIKISIHTALWRIFSIRPENNAEDPFETNTEFCIYDETHTDYVYEPVWIDFIVHLLQSQQLTLEQIKLHESKKEKLDIEKYKLN